MYDSFVAVVTTMYKYVSKYTLSSSFSMSIQYNSNGIDSESNLSSKIDVSAGQE